MTKSAYYKRHLSRSALLAILCVMPALSWAATATDSGSESRVAAAASSDSSRWDAISQQLFNDRVIHEGTSSISLEAPVRAFDSARVPVVIRAITPQSKSDYVKTLWLIVDKNPLPVAGTFHFEPNNGWDTIDTELRVNEYTNVRVVAERNDGSLHMAAAFVKAAGGCSAPPSSYERSNATLLGNFNGGIDQFLDPKVPAVARIRITHPNASGMQFDQFSRTYIPAQYIHTLGAELNGELLFTVDTNFSFSQDPVLGFNFKPESDGELTFYALDSENRRFQKSWPVKVSQTN
ncbi:MAG: quinoprotein dehydrogenase-associated SoxYZ-like carrier [Granulosicoccus sp.]